MFNVYFIRISLPAADIWTTCECVCMHVCVCVGGGGGGSYLHLTTAVTICTELVVVLGEL